MKADEPRFLVTAGPTREWIDPVRFISNRSSGRMGYALAQAARAVSRSVTLISGPTALSAPTDVVLVPVVTAQEMCEAVLSRYEASDIVIMAAAVCDFRPRAMATDKIQKESFSGNLELAPTVDILAELGRLKTHQTLVGFAVETRDRERNAGVKLTKKNLDLIVANAAEAFETESSAVTLMWKDGRVERMAHRAKNESAAMIVARAMELRR